jgi:hypothetical protein
LFKFQIVIPIALILLLWRRWRFVLGFSASAMAAIIISLLMVGLRGVRQYVTMLLGMSLNLRTSSDALLYSISPRTMLNLRGVLSALLDGHVGHWWIQGLIAASSVAVLVAVARCRPSLPLAILASALVSYHLNAPDASILIIPVGLCLSSGSVRAALAAVAVLIFSCTAILPLYGFLGAIPILTLFVIWVSQQNLFEWSRAQPSAFGNRLQSEIVVGLQCS